jgi:transketolase
MEDIALMCSLPGSEVVCPADAQQTRDLLPQIIESLNTTYIRLAFPKIPKIISANSSELGKIQVLKNGKDITLISTGLMVYKTLQAAEKLEKRGVSAEVLNVHTIKPIDEETLFDSLKKTECGIIVEEHNIYGGLGSIVATIVSKNNPVPLDFVNTGDKFGDTGLPEEILTAYGLQPKNIIEKSIKLIEKAK